MSRPSAHRRGAPRSQDKPYESAIDTLNARGYVVLDGLTPEYLITSINGTFDIIFEDSPFCKGDFYGSRTKRLGSLLKRTMNTDALIRHPAILELVEHVLGPWCDTIQLNLGQAIEVHPGALAQFPHRDQDMWGGPVGEIEYLVNVMWPLSPFRAENGATVIYPGSHGEQARREEPTSSPIAIECDPGSAIIFLGSTLHGAGANRTHLPRRGIIISYCLGWLKPYENPWLVYPPEIARNFAPELAALVGYRQHRPNLGNYEGRCPSILLQDGPLPELSAVDALRPDQATQVAKYVAEQIRAGEGSTR